MRFSGQVDRQLIEMPLIWSLLQLLTEKLLPWSPHKHVRFIWGVILGVYTHFFAGLISFLALVENVTPFKCTGRLHLLATRKHVCKRRIEWCLLEQQTINNWDQSWRASWIKGIHSSITEAIPSADQERMMTSSSLQGRRMMSSCTLAWWQQSALWQV